MDSVAAVPLAPPGEIPAAVCATRLDGGGRNNCSNQANGSTCANAGLLSVRQNSKLTASNTTDSWLRQKPPCKLLRPRIFHHELAFYRTLFLDARGPLKSVRS